MVPNQSRKRFTTEKMPTWLYNSLIGLMIVCIACAIMLSMLLLLIYSGIISANILSSDVLPVRIIKQTFFNQSTYGENDCCLEVNNEEVPPPPLTLDKDLYDRKIYSLAHKPFPGDMGTSTQTALGSTTQTSTNSTSTKPSQPELWPVKTEYPRPGAILPFKRVIAYYGNLYSTRMGALGEYPEDEMLARLDAEVTKWQIADPATPVVPALHYITVTAQQAAGEDGKYRARMPFSEIDKILAMAKKINGIVFLDFQAGLSTLQDELPLYSKYIEMPNVHIGIDPEFAMLTSGKRPGTVVGTLDAADINFVSKYLSEIVLQKNIPPKILVVHRYTRPMVTNYKNIETRPEVQIVMHMDGWGDRDRKLASYREYIYKEPVQFTGFKIFYKNDIRSFASKIVNPPPLTISPSQTSGTSTKNPIRTLPLEATIMSPEEVLKLNPVPSYIQYQ